MAGVDCMLKSRKLTPHFISPYKILQKFIEVAYGVALPPFLSNLHDDLHVSQLRKYILDLSHLIQVDDVQVINNFTV